jgi:hypothetical protein
LGNLGEGDYLKDPSVDGRNNNMMDLQEVRCEGVGWIELAKDRDR